MTSSSLRSQCREVVSDRPDDPVGQQAAALLAQAVDDDERGDGVGDVVLDLVGLGAELGVAAGLAGEEDEEPGPVGLDEGEVGTHAVLDLLAGAVGLGRGLADLVAEALADVAEQLGEEVALGAEVLVQHRLGDPGGVGDGVHRRALVAVLGELLDRDLQQLLAPLGGGQASHQRSSAGSWDGFMVTAR